MTRTFALRYAPLLVMLFISNLVAAEPLPIDDFTRSDELGTMKISPDGTFIAMTAGQHGAEFLSFVDLANHKVAGGVRAPDGLEILDFHWASNTRVIFMIAERQPGRVRPTATGEIFAVDRDGKRQTRIYGYRAQEQSTGTHMKVKQASYATPSIVSLLDGDDRHILITEMPWKLSGNYWQYNPDARPQLTLLNIDSGSEQRRGSVPLADAHVIVDRNEEPRFAIGSDARYKLAVAWKADSKGNWESFELAGFREETVVPRIFTADNRAALFTGVPQGERYASLFQMQLADRSIKKLISIPDADVDDLVMDFQDREVIGVTGYTDKLVYQWLLPNDSSARLQQALHRAFKDNEVSFINHSQDGKRALVFVRSDVAPGEFLLFDTQTKKADMLRAARGWTDLKAMRPKEAIHLTARDGTPLHGYVTRPSGSGPYPTIVLPHGGPHGIRDVWSFDWEAQLFANRGYAVLQINFRGSGGYGIDFEAAGWAIEQKLAVRDRICIVGASYGGYAALMGVVREPDLYRCAIGYSGVYDLELMFASGDTPESDRGLAYLDRILGHDLVQLRDRSPVNHVEKIKVPVLLVHGKADWRADYEQATRMKSALEARQKPFQWIALRREGHGIYDDATRLEVYTDMLKFLDTHLMQAVAAPQ